MINIFKDYKVFDINPDNLRSKNFYKNFVIDEREKFWEKRSCLIKNDTQAQCFLCNNKNKNTKFLEHNGYKLFKCSKCSSVFANIKIDDDYYNIVYNNTQYEDMIKKEVLDTYEYRKNTFGKERLKYIQEKCSFKDNDILLDIGCGPGYFLKYLHEKGIKCKGLELTQYLVDICTDQGLDVEKKYISQVEVSNR